MIKVLDNPFYYLENFHQVLAWIAERYDDLLTAEERHFLAVFPTLPQASRAVRAHGDAQGHRVPRQ
jgi:hypothetical protein